MNLYFYFKRTAYTEEKVQSADLPHVDMHLHLLTLAWADSPDEDYSFGKER